MPAVLVALLVFPFAVSVATFFLPVRASRVVSVGESIVWVVNHDSPKKARVTSTTRTAVTTSCGSERPPDTMSSTG